MRCTHVGVALPTDRWWREGRLRPHSVGLERTSVEELSGDLSGTVGPGSTCLGQPVKGGQEGQGAGLKQLAVGENVLRVSLRPKRRRLGTWRKGVGSPTQTRQFWVRNDQRSSNWKPGGGGRGALS